MPHSKQITSHAPTYPPHPKPPTPTQPHLTHPPTYPPAPKPTTRCQVLGSYREAQKALGGLKGLSELTAFAEAWDAVAYHDQVLTVGQLVKDAQKVK